jgi:hypothetical protein
VVKERWTRYRTAVLAGGVHGQRLRCVGMGKGRCTGSAILTTDGNSDTTLRLSLQRQRP